MKSSYDKGWTSPEELPLIKEVDQIKDEDKTKEEPIKELVGLRQRIVELERLETRSEQAEWVGKSFQPLVHPDDLSFAIEIFELPTAPGFKRQADWF